MKTKLCSPRKLHSRRKKKRTNWETEDPVGQLITRDVQEQRRCYCSIPSRSSNEQSRSANGLDDTIDLLFPSPTCVSFPDSPISPSEQMAPYSTSLRDLPGSYGWQRMSILFHRLLIHYFPHANDSQVIVLWINPFRPRNVGCKWEGEGAEEARLGTSRAQIQSSTKHSSINQTAAFPNPAGSQRSPAGKQKLTPNGDNLSLECCHICKISLAMLRCSEERCCRQANEMKCELCREARWHSRSLEPSLNSASNAERNEEKFIFTTSRCCCN